MAKINLTLSAANKHVQIDFLASDNTTVSGTKYINAPWLRLDAPGVYWKIDAIDEYAFNHPIFFADIVNINGSAIGATTYAQVTELLVALNTASSDITVDVGDIDIGNVKLEGSTGDKAAVTDANMARSATDHVLSVQQLAPDGTVPPSGSLVTNAPFTKITNGVNTADVDTAKNLMVNVAVAPANSHDQVTHYTPVHGIATYTSASTITLTGFPVVPDIANCKIVSLSVIPLAGTTVVRYENGINGYYIGCSSGVVTIYLNGVAVNAFLATDLKYEVRLCIYPRAEDVTNDVKKVSVESQPLPTTSGPEVLLSVAQTLTASAVDTGYEVATSGCEVIGVWPKITVNAATAITMIVLCKHTALATNEYSLVTEDVMTGVNTLTSMTFSLPAANGLYFIPIKLNKVVPYIQIQFLDVTGTTHATVDSLEITKPA